MLPATVVSRCQQLELHPLSASEVEAALSQRWGVERQKARLLARLCHGCLGWAVLLASDERLLRQRAERLEGLLDILSGDYEVRFGYVTQLVAWFGQSRALVQEVLDLWLDWWRDLLLVKLGSSDGVTNIDHESVLVNMARDYRLAQIRAVINSIQATGEQLRQNANPRLAFEVLMLSIPVRSSVRVWLRLLAYVSKGRAGYITLMPLVLNLKVDDYVVVKTTRGLELGRVMIAPKQVLASEESEGTEGLKPVVRKAEPEDIKRAEELEAKEVEAMAECGKLIAKLGLPMKLLGAEYNLDGSRLTFFFSAAERVDFRDLVRELLAVLR